MYRCQIRYGVRRWPDMWWWKGGRKGDTVEDTKEGEWVGQKEGGSASST